jgi:dienelactone hydrolase
LHGVPGVEKNLDLAYALRDAGWNILYFHYRGCWGSEGDYSFTGLVDDVWAAMDWLVRQPSVDRQRMALTGSSMGGYATLAAGAADSRFKALAPMCPLADPGTAPLAPEMAVEFASMLHGITSVELQRQWNSLPPLTAYADQFAGRQILLVTGDRDELFPPAHYSSLLAAVPGLRWQRFAEADHAFSTCRAQLVETVVTWLQATV